MAKRKTKTTAKPEERDIRQVLDELLELGWKELKEKAEADGKPLRVQPPSRYASSDATIVHASGRSSTTSKPWRS